MVLVVVLVYILVVVVLPLLTTFINTTTTTTTATITTNFTTNFTNTFTTQHTLNYGTSDDGCGSDICWVLMMVVVMVRYWSLVNQVNKYWICYSYTLHLQSCAFLQNLFLVT